MSLRDNEHAAHSVEGPSASGCTSFAQLELRLLIAARPAYLNAFAPSNTLAYCWGRTCR